VDGKKLNVMQERAIYEWGKEFELTVRSEIKREMEHQYQIDLLRAVNYFIISIAFVLHFGETTRFGKKRLGLVLNEIELTVDMFNKKEYSPKDYVKMLKDDGINLNMGEIE
jgi:hypothetical protein